MIFQAFSNQHDEAKQVQRENWANSDWEPRAPASRAGQGLRYALCRMFLLVVAPVSMQSGSQ